MTFFPKARRKKRRVIYCLETWSCAMCLYPYGDPHQLMTHIATCPNLQSSSKSKTDENAPNNQTNIFYKFNHCALTFSEIKKRTAQDVHGHGASEEVVASSLIRRESYKPSNLDKNACFLCCMRFPTVEMYTKHLHHVHMRWVNKGAIDYSKVEYSGITGENEGEIGQDIQEIQSNHLLEMSLNQNEPSSMLSDFEQFEINVKSQMNRQQIFAQGTTETAEGEDAVTVQSLLDQLENVSEFISSDLTDSSATKLFDVMEFFNVTSDKTVVNRPLVKEESEVSKAYKRLGEFDISFDDLPDDKELAEIGLQNKIGQFCHLCDAVIKSYRLYYLHMHSFHQLEKRFECIITTCGRTFTQALAFQKHALNHNHKIEHYCIMCDNVFGDDEELEDHMISSDHANKYLQVQVFQ